MSFRKQIGQNGENIAADYLQEQGYTILERNLSCRYGEVDLVAEQGDRLYFVEIRYRSNASFGSALDSVTLAKQRKIRSTATYWLNQKPEWQNRVPFLSVLTLDEEADGHLKIEFLPDAFG